MITSIDDAEASLVSNARLSDENLLLSLPEMTLTIKSNSIPLLDELRRYFAFWVSSEDIRSNSQTKVQNIPLVQEIVAIDRAPVDLDVNWQDWSREPGKAGRKDAYAELPEARLIRKVRTGMVFLQSARKRIVAGPCLENISQVINFVGNQYMNFLQQQQWKICHAAAVALDDRALAIAGLSGGGKSTLMLHLLNDDKLNFITNDRLFIKVNKADVIARGIPKLPRINPGTIINNSKLGSILNSDERDRFEALPGDELWRLEQKYDVDIVRVYGKERIAKQAGLKHFIVLNWTPGSNDETTIKPFEVSQKPAMLKAIMKSSGPFYQYPNGQFYKDDSVLDVDAYTEILREVEMIEVSGGVDFDKLSQFCLKELLSQ